MKKRSAKKNNSKKSPKYGLNVYGERCIVKEITIQKETANEQCIAIMESYIQMQDNRTELMDEFASLRMLGINYPQIKKWFLNRFSEFTHTAA